jgi:CheY-like chemotaxis protein
MSLVGDYTILAIEDNLSNLRLLEAILKCRPGISLLSAMQGSVGLDFATQFVPDVILLDLNLPDMTDTQVLEKLKAAQVTRDIPVIIVSADAMQSQIQRLLSAGANDYMTKPYDVQQLLKLIDSYLPVHTEDFLKTT